MNNETKPTTRRSMIQGISGEATLNEIARIASDPGHKAGLGFIIGDHGRVLVTTTVPVWEAEVKDLEFLRAGLDKVITETKKVLAELEAKK